MTTGTISRSLIAVAVAIGCSACDSKHTEDPSATTAPPATAPAPPPSPPASVIHTNDVKVATQLLSGFYNIEANAWRWTAGKFSASLAVPPGAAQNGGTLTFDFAIADGSIKKLGDITLSASVNGTALPPAKYTKAGNTEYTASIPASALTGDTVKVDFALDKSVPPTPGVDGRQLGVVASSIALKSK